MTFVFIGALAAVLLVAAPLMAHLLRARKAREQPFAPAALVPGLPPKARRRSRIEDRSLFALRVLSILALVLLGATPLVQCARLAIHRTAGASVALALVVDDSMSMRAGVDGRTRFEIAKAGALDLVSDAHTGDVVAVVLAGAPPRVALAATSDVETVVDVLKELQVSDRATDLDGALTVARSILSDLPHKDRRIVLLSDLCDGQPQAAPVGEELDVALWAPRRGLDGDAQDCAVIRAQRRGSSVQVRVACSGAQARRDRAIEARVDETTVARQPLDTVISGDVAAADLSLDLAGAKQDPNRVVLVGPADSIPANDSSPISLTVDTLAIGTISDPDTATVATGGPPPVEQALAALESRVTVRPLTTVPDTIEDLSPYQALILDDPLGLTPEARVAIRRWLERGGVALVALGPRAASAPLGSSLDPFIDGVPRWEMAAPAGIDGTTGALLGPSIADLSQLNAKGRATFRLDDHPSEVLVRWSDGSPWLARRTFALGSAFVLGLPMNADHSDLIVRPAFLSLLSYEVDVAGTRGGNQRIEVGKSWSFSPAQRVEAMNEQGPSLVEKRGKTQRLSPTTAGRYDLRIDGTVETRFAEIAEREVDLRRRRASAKAIDPALGGSNTWVDLSPYLVLALLGLLVGEMVLRVVASLGEKRARQAG